MFSIGSKGLLCPEKLGDQSAILPEYPSKGGMDMQRLFTSFLIALLSVLSFLALPPHEFKAAYNRLAQDYDLHQIP